MSPADSKVAAAPQEVPPKVVAPTPDLAATPTLVPAPGTVPPPVVVPMTTTLMRRRSRSLARGWLLVGALLVLGSGSAGAAAVFGQRVEEASATLSESIVPDEALSAAFLGERRAQLAADAAALETRLADRGNPAPLLAEIEQRAKASGAEAAVSAVAVAPYDGQGDPTFGAGAGGGDNAEAPYVVVIVTVEARGAWKSVASYARALESLPYAARVERLRLSVAQDKSGAAVWTMLAEVRAVAR